VLSCAYEVFLDCLQLDRGGFGGLGWLHLDDSGQAQSHQPGRSSVLDHSAGHAYIRSHKGLTFSPTKPSQLVERSSAVTLCLYLRDGCHGHWQRCPATRVRISWILDARSVLLLHHRNIGRTGSCLSHLSRPYRLRLNSRSDLADRLKRNDYPSPRVYAPPHGSRGLHSGYAVGV